MPDAAELTWPVSSTSERRERQCDAWRAAPAACHGGGIGCAPDARGRARRAPRTATSAASQIGNQLTRRVPPPAPTTASVPNAVIASPTIVDHASAIVTRGARRHRAGETRRERRPATYAIANAPAVMTQRAEQPGREDAPGRAERADRELEREHGADEDEEPVGRRVVRARARARTSARFASAGAANAPSGRSTRSTVGANTAIASPHTHAKTTIRYAVVRLGALNPVKIG